jgi:hypothetical protein
MAGSTSPRCPALQPPLSLQSSPFLAGEGRPVLLGITERLEFVDAPGHVADLARYRARGYAMKGNRIAILTDRDMDVIEVHPPSLGSVDLGGLTIERCPPRPAMG